MATRRSKPSGMPKVAKVPRAPKAAPPTAATVAVRLLALFPPDAPSALWKDADLKRRLAAVERPQFPAALDRLQEERQILALTHGKATLYLFTGPWRHWLAGTAGETAEGVPATAVDLSFPHLFFTYTQLVGRSGGFPDVKIADLLTALAPVSAEILSTRLISLWREGKATFSQGDWSLANETTRAAAVELVGERYLLVRLDEVVGD